jgi:hypothetical protein
MIIGVCFRVAYLSVSVLVLSSSSPESSSDASYSIPTRNTRSKSMKVSSDRPSHWASLLYLPRTPGPVLMLFTLAECVWNAYDCSHLCFFVLGSLTTFSMERFLPVVRCVRVETDSPSSSSPSLSLIEM